MHYAAEMQPPAATVKLNRVDYPLVPIPGQIKNLFFSPYPSSLDGKLVYHQVYYRRPVYC